MIHQNVRLLMFSPVPFAIPGIPARFLLHCARVLLGPWVLLWIHGRLRHAQEVLRPPKWISSGFTMDLPWIFHCFYHGVPQNETENNGKSMVNPLVNHYLPHWRATTGGTLNVALKGPFGFLSTKKMSLFYVLKKIRTTFNSQQTDISKAWPFRKQKN